MKKAYRKVFSRVCFRSARSNFNYSSLCNCILIKMVRLELTRHSKVCQRYYHLIAVDPFILILRIVVSKAFQILSGMLLLRFDLSLTGPKILLQMPTNVYSMIGLVLTRIHDSVECLPQVMDRPALHVIPSALRHLTANSVLKSYSTCSSVVVAV